MGVSPKGGGRGWAPGERGGGVDRRLLEDASLDGPRGELVSVSGLGTRERVARE